MYLIFFLDEASVFVHSLSKIDLPNQNSDFEANLGLELISESPNSLFRTRNKGKRK